MRGEEDDLGVIKKTMHVAILPWNDYLVQPLCDPE